jgi:hypothetical protein
MTTPLLYELMDAFPWLFAGAFALGVYLNMKGDKS